MLCSHSGKPMPSCSSQEGGGAFTNTIADPTLISDTSDREPDARGCDMAAANIAEARGSETADALDTTEFESACLGGGGGMAAGKNLGAGGAEPTVESTVFCEATCLGATGGGALQRPGSDAADVATCLDATGGGAFQRAADAADMASGGADAADTIDTIDDAAQLGGALVGSRIMCER